MYINLNYLNNPNIKENNGSLIIPSSYDDINDLGQIFKYENIDINNLTSQTLSIEIKFSYDIIKASILKY